MSVAMSSQEEPASLKSVIMVADAINHARPTHSELQASVGWLRAKNLVSVEGKKYSLTSKGEKFYKSHAERFLYISDTWKSITAEFSSRNLASEPDKLTKDDVINAYDDYKKGI